MSTAFACLPSMLTARGLTGLRRELTQIHNQTKLLYLAHGDSENYVKSTFLNEKPRSVSDKTADYHFSAVWRNAQVKYELSHFLEVVSTFRGYFPPFHFPVSLNCSQIPVHGYHSLICPLYIVMYASFSRSSSSVYL